MGLWSKWIYREVVLQTALICALSMTSDLNSNATNGLRHQHTMAGKVILIVYKCIYPMSQSGSQVLQNQSLFWQASTYSGLQGTTTVLHLRTPELSEHKLVTYKQKPQPYLTRITIYTHKYINLCIMQLTISATFTKESSTLTDQFLRIKSIMCAQNFTCIQ